MFRLLLPAVVLFSLAAPARAADAEFKPLFPTDSLEGWHYSDWSNVATPQKVPGTPWQIKDGVLSGLGKRTWIFSEKEYGDFVLEFEWMLSEGSNGGLGLRFPPDGDPAYRGMEIQIVDEGKYYADKGRPEQGTGSIYDNVPPTKPKINPPGQWNKYQVTCRGSKVTLLLNGEKVIDEDLSQHKVVRQGAPEGTKPLAERPLKGRIGFQNLSGSITLRDIRIKILE
jgi:hypothetical protein